jgi:uncharacterized coiled-coil DUF342 family protein
MSEVSEIKNKVSEIKTEVKEAISKINSIRHNPMNAFRKEDAIRECL